MGTAEGHLHADHLQCDDPADAVLCGARGTVTGSRLPPNDRQQYANFTVSGNKCFRFF